MQWDNSGVGQKNNCTCEFDYLDRNVFADCFSYCSSNTYWADESMKKLLLRKETKIFIRKLLTVQVF